MKRCDVSKIILLTAAIIILYLFALNGRYTYTNHDSMVMFDKWKRQWIGPSDVSLIEVK